MKGGKGMILAASCSCVTLASILVADENEMGALTRPAP